MTLSLPVSGEFCEVSFFLHKFRSLNVTIADDLSKPLLSVDGPNSEEVSICSYPVGSGLLVSQHIHDISTVACKDKAFDKHSRLRFVSPSLLDVSVRLPRCQKIIIRTANALRENHRASIDITGSDLCRPEVLLDASQCDCTFLKVSKAAGFLMDSNLKMPDGISQVIHSPFSKKYFVSAATMNNGKIKKGDIVLPMPPLPS